MLWAPLTNKHSCLFHWNGGRHVSDRCLKTRANTSGWSDPLNVLEEFSILILWANQSQQTAGTHRWQQPQLFVNYENQEPAWSVCWLCRRSFCYECESYTKCEKVFADLCGVTCFPSSAQNIAETAIFYRKKKRCNGESIFLSTGPSNVALTWVRVLFNWSDTSKTEFCQTDSRPLEQGTEAPIAPKK